MPTQERPEREGSAGLRLSDDAYERLRGLARFFLGRERRDHTLQPTALANEAFLRLSAGENGADGADPAHPLFLRAAASAMRRVLVDHARARRAVKRGGAARREPLDAALLLYETNSQGLVAVDEALIRLERFDPELATLVDLRFFGGLNEEETAAVLGVSARTVRRGWRAAKLWLSRELSADGD
jgi:RNA polymerase sigma factor (TIGR02999 family)